MHDSKSKPKDRAVPSNSAQEINRVKSSPAIPLHFVERLPPPEITLPQNIDNIVEHEREEASVSSVSVLTAENASITNSVSKKKHSKNHRNPYDTSKKGLKSKRENTNIDLNPPPPNFDMLAKFALEKERFGIQTISHDFVLGKRNFWKTQIPNTLL